MFLIIFIFYNYMRSITLLFLLMPVLGWSQNLVPNPSFEEYEECPTEAGQPERALYWHSARESSDYLNACAPGDEINSQSIDVPTNHAGYQEAATGSAYCGLFTYVAIDDYREYIQCELLSPLTEAQTYYFSMKVSRGEGFGVPFDHYNVATNNVGAYFTTSANDNVNNPLGIFDFAHINFTEIITDTNNWVLLTGQFIPDAAYTHMALGNFFQFDQTVLLNLDGNPNYAAYYLIDDVCLSVNPECDVENFVQPTSKLPVEIIELNANYLEIYANDRVELQVCSIDGKILLAVELVEGYNRYSIGSIKAGIVVLRFIESKSVSIIKYFKP